MSETLLPFVDPAFEALLARTATFCNAPAAAALLEQLDRQGAMAPLDWFLLRDLLTLSGVDAPEAVLLLILLLRSRNQGSLCLSLAPERLQEQLTEAETAAVLAWLGHAPATLIARTPETGAPLVHDPATGLLYFQKLYLAEAALKEILEKRLTLPDPLPGPLLLAPLLADVLTANPPLAGKTPVRLNNAQITAVLCGLTRSLSLITGGPGTGKTSLVAALLRCLVRTGVRAEAIRLAAPTGRAAQRLSDAIRAALATIKQPTPEDESVLTITSSTIHKLLSWSVKKGEFHHDAGNPVPCDVLIVDEASMVSADLMAALLAALPQECRLVLIGDKDQLPSVDAGAVLADLLPDTPAFSPQFTSLLSATTGITLESGGTGRFRDRVVFLTESYRSEVSILRFAAAVNSGDTTAAALPEFTPGTGTTVWSALEKTGSCLRIEPPTGKELLAAWIRERMMDRTGPVASWKALLERVAAVPVDTLGGAAVCRELFIRLSSARILTALRRGPTGCEAINRFLVARFREEFDPDREGPLFHGLPVLVTENDADKNLFNGDVGLVVRCRGASGRPAYRVVFDRPEQLPVFTPDELPAWEPAFAITVHKSQGSEYGEVLLLLPEEPAHTLNTREILYTGVTRGKERSVVAGSTEAVTAAVLTPSRRESGLGLWSRGGVRQPGRQQTGFG